MRNVLVSYRELMKLTNEAMEKNKNMYSPRVAEEYNSVLREKKNADYNDAYAEIGKIFDKIRTLLAKGNFPVPSELTDDDLNVKKEGSSRSALQASLFMKLFE